MGWRNIKLNNSPLKKKRLSIVTNLWQIWPCTLISVPIFCQSVHVTSSGNHHPCSQQFYSSVLFCQIILNNIMNSVYMNLKRDENQIWDIHVVQSCSKRKNNPYLSPELTFFPYQSYSEPYDNHQVVGVCFPLLS